MTRDELKALDTSRSGAAPPFDPERFAERVVSEHFRRKRRNTRALGTAMLLIIATGLATTWMQRNADIPVTSDRIVAHPTMDNLPGQVARAMTDAEHSRQIRDLNRRVNQLRSDFAHQTASLDDIERSIARAQLFDEVDLSDLDNIFAQASPTSID